MLYSQSIISGGFLSFSISKVNDSISNTDAGGIAMFHDSYNKCLISQGGSVFGESKIFDKIGDFDDRCFQKKQKLSYKVFPNPNDGNFFIIGSEIKDIVILDVLGRTIKSFSFNELLQNELYINISDQSEGNYFVIIITYNGDVNVLSVVKLNR